MITGQNMYKFNGQRIIKGWPKSLRSLGKQDSSKIKGSTYWTSNDIAYMFDDRGRYYRYDVKNDKFIKKWRSITYPASVSLGWTGMPSSFDTVFNAIDNQLTRGLIQKDNGLRREFAIENKLQHLTFFVTGYYYEIHLNTDMKKVHFSFGKFFPYFL